MNNIKIKSLQKNNTNYKVLLEAVTDLLTEIAAEDPSLKSNGLIDFSKYLFVLPTQEASRIFREKIAELFAPQGGVLSLNTVLPEYFIYNQIPNKQSLSQEKTLEIWYQVLDKMQNNFGENIFKNNIWDRQKNNTAWKLAVCKMFQHLRKDIALEQGLNCRDFYDENKNKPWDSEAERNFRFEEFLQYEEKFIELKTDNFCDEADLILWNINQTQLTDKNIKKIILLDCCELKKSVINCLNNLKDVEIELYLNVSKSELGLFDEFGHVKIDEIRKIKLNLDFETQIAEYDKPIDMAKKIYNFISDSSTQSLPSCIGVLSSEIIPYLEYLLKNSADNQIKIYSPHSAKLSTCPWTNLFLEILSLKTDIYNVSFEQTAKLIRNGLISNYLSCKIENFNYKKLLETLDNLQADHLLDSFTNLEKFAEKDELVLKVLAEIKSWNNILNKNDDTLIAAWSILTQIGEENDLSNLDIDKSEQELNELKKLITEFAKLQNEELKLELLKFALRDKELTFKGDNGEAINLAGFLELSWAADKNLLIAGMNEQNFNCSESNNLFIPEKVREALSFTSQKNRHATDIYRFYALTKAHNLGIMIGRSNNAGDILKPARLLFYLDDDALINSCNLLFSGKLYENITDKSNNKNKEYFKYYPHIADLQKNTISVSSLRTYLDCPYKFYLQETYRNQEINDRNSELENNQTGTIIHEVLREGQNDLNSTISGEKLERLLETSMRKNYGNLQNALIEIQKAYMLKTLFNFTRHHTEYLQNKDNFHIIATELPFKIPLYKFVGNQKFANIFFKGQIDRIDYFEEVDNFGITRKVIQLLDYKTTTKEKNPFTSHISKVTSKDESEWRNWQFFELTDDGIELNTRFGNTEKIPEKWYFSDVQLPLYAAIIKNNPELIEEQMKKIDCNFNINNYEIRTAYFTLSASEELGGEKRFFKVNYFVQDALTILEKAATKIFLERKFWEPNFHAKYQAEILELLGKVSMENFAEPNFK